MRGVNPSDNEWVELGRAAKSIRDYIMDFCIISCNRFGKSSSMYKSFKTLESDFLKVRSKLDDFVSGAYPMNIHEISGCSITNIFFGENLHLSPVVYSYKRGEMPKSFDETQERDLFMLLKNIDLFLTSLNKHDYIVSRFKEKEAKGRLTRFKKSVEKLQQKIK